jgi:hypothetical protein
MDEKVPAVGRRRHVLNEQTVRAVVGIPICQREIQRTLYLSAKLPRFSFGLSTGRWTVGCSSAQSLGKFGIYEIC